MAAQFQEVCADSISSSICLLAGRKPLMPYPCWISLIVPQWCLATAERSPGKMLRSVKYVIMPPSVCYLFSRKCQALIYFMNKLKKKKWKPLHHKKTTPKNQPSKTQFKKTQPNNLQINPTTITCLCSVRVWGILQITIILSYGWPRLRKNNHTSFVKEEKIFMPKYFVVRSSGKHSHYAF